MDQGKLALISPSQAALYIPPGLKKFKLDLFERIGRHMIKLGGLIVRDDEKKLLELPDDIMPIIGCTPALRQLVLEWKKRKRNFIYWDRGYCRRVFATHLPRGTDGGYYRWHVNAFQLRKIGNHSSDRWKNLHQPVAPWNKNGKHILICAPTFTYSLFHATQLWTDTIIDTLARVTDRPLMIRGKESKRSLGEDIKGAHAVVSHGSNAAVEAAIMGCPAFVDDCSAASLLRNVDLVNIEKPVYADREPWVYSLAYNQFNEKELVDGTLWRLLN